MMEFDQLRTYIPTHGQSLFALQTAKLLKKRKDGSLSSEPKVDSKKGKLLRDLQSKLAEKEHDTRSRKRKRAGDNGSANAQSENSTNAYCGNKNAKKSTRLVKIG